MPRFLGFLVVLSLTSPLLGAGRELGGVRAEAPLTVYAPSSVASIGDRFLVAWNAFWLNYSALQFAIVDADGRRGPATTIGTFPSQPGSPAVVATADGYAVILATRMAIVSEDGRVLRQMELPSDMPAKFVTTDGNRVAIVSQPAERDVRILVVDTFGRAVTDRRIVMPFGAFVRDATFAGGDVVLGVRAIASTIIRIPVAGGPVTTTEVGSYLVPELAVAGEDVLATWTVGGNGFVSARVTGDGHVSTTAPFATNHYQIDWYSLARAGKGFVLVFRATEDPKSHFSTAIYGVRLDTAGKPIDSPILLMEGQNAPNVAATHDRALLVAGPSAILLDTTTTLRVLQTETIAQQRPTQRNFGLASDGLDFVTSFDEGLSAALANVRFDGEPGGTAQDFPSSRVSRQPIAFGGNVYLHVAQERQRSIVLRRFTAAGSLIGEISIPAEAAVFGAPAVAWDGKEFLVVWTESSQLSGMFVSPDGSAGGEFRIVPRRDYTSFQSPRIAFDGTRFAVTYAAVPLTGFPTIVSSFPIEAVTVAPDGAAGLPVLLFESLQASAPIASSGHDFLVVGNVGNNLIAWRLVANGDSLRTERKTTILRGLDVAASTAWNGGAYVVVWRALGPYDYSRTIPQSFLGMTHVHGDGMVDPLATIPTGIYDTLHPEPPAVAVNDLGVELMVIDELRELGGSPRAIVYRSDEVSEHVVPPSAPLITGERFGADGVSVTWVATSGNQRGFIVTAVPRFGGATRTIVPAGTSSLTLPSVYLPITVMVEAWNEAGTSQAAAVLVTPPHRTPGRR